MSKRDQVDDTCVSRQLLVTSDDAAAKWRVLDFSHEQSEADPCESFGDIPLLDEVDNWETRSADNQLLSGTR